VCIGHVISLVIVAAVAATALSNVEAGTLTAVAVAGAGVAAAVPRRLIPFVAVITSAAVAASGSALARDRALRPITDSIPLGTAQTFEVDGVLARDAVVTPEGATRLVVDARAIRVGDRASTSARFRVQAHVGGSQAGHLVAQWTRGRRIRLPMTIKDPGLTLNPGGWSPRWQVLRRGFHFQGTVKSAWLVETLPGSRWNEAITWVRQSVRRAIQETCARRTPETGVVLAAVLVGDRAGLDRDIERRLQLAGTFHVIAISGGNVALVVAVAMVVTRTFVRSYRVVIVLVSVALTLYGLILGGDPSVARAVTAALIYLATLFFRINASPLHVLGVTAAIIALVDPLEVLAPGAWLSYGATLGILLLARATSTFLHTRSRARASIAGRIIDAGAVLLGATIAAELLLLPVSAVLFGRVGVAGLLLNFVAVPAMAVAQMSGMLAVVVWVGLPELASHVTLLSELAVAGIVDSARLVDVAPWLTWRVAPPAFGWVVAFYIALGLTWFARRHLRLYRMGVALLTSFMAGLLTSPERALARPAAGRLRVAMLDVGQGEAILVQFPNGQSLLVDAGNATPTFDVGERIVVPAAQALGVRRLDWLAVTHPDLDHIGGASAVAAALRPSEVWEGVPVPRDPHWHSFKSAMVSSGVAWRQLQAHDRLTIGDVLLEVVAPHRPDWERQRSRNDDSLVLRLKYGETEWLLTGDISATVEDSLGDDEPSRALRVLKVAHHGSRTSTTPDFVDRYAPVMAFVSAGAGNVFGHPTPAVLSRLSTAHVHVFRTDVAGAIIVETDGVSVFAETMTGQKWQASGWRSPP
jgi:competence protein ComEC